jgi:Rab GDP dissociation inhibitor
MDEEYDVIVLGTGLKECILSGLLSVSGKKVLHLDRNDYYGAESASLNLKQLFKKFEGSDEKVDEKELGPSKNFSIDLCPKFIMGCENLVKMLLHTKVTRYLEFRHVDGSFVYNKGKLYEVPMTPTAALSSSLMGFMQKRKYKSFLQWVLDVDMNDTKTWGKLDLNKTTMSEVYSYFGCDEDTQAFTGHAVALYTDDTYLEDPKEVVPCIERLKLYAYSLNRFEKSPYIYPQWGLGGLPEGFSRLAAVHGGVYMLRREITEIKFDDKGHVTGVTAKHEGKIEGTAKCKQLIADPSYFLDTDRVKKTGTVARWLCILDHPVEGTGSAQSAQIILPCKQTGHKSDIYISVMSSALQVAPKDRYLAMISAQVYTNNPKRELAPAYQLLGKVMKDFFLVNDTYVPVKEIGTDGVFISSSMDATTHFQASSREVMTMYKALTGKDVDLTENPETIEEQFS